ncbi:MAG: CDP-alcohol phosphatidyltransferase family protein, partial [Myxococcales bacterium]
MTLWQEWHEEYRRSLKPRELEELADLLFCRPPAFVIAKALKRTPVTPDAVSLFAVLWSLVVSACYWQGHYVASLLGATAYFAWNILDCVDGQLARMRGGGSPIGHIIDEVADVLSTIALWVGIAHHLTVQRPGEHNWWLLSVVTGLVMAIECSVLEGKRHEWMARVLGIRKSVRADLEHVTRVAAGWRAERTHLFGRFVIGFYIGMRWLQHVYLPPSADPVYGTADNT